MANYQKAPTLRFNGEKAQGETKQTYQIPQQLADIVFKELGNSSAQLRIMMVLIGTKPDSFNIAEKWILERTGLQHASYINARKALVQRGWLSLDAAQAITINFDVIYGKSNVVLPEEKTEEKSKSNTILPEKSNVVLREKSNVVLPIIDKQINNSIDNTESAAELPPPSGFAAQKKKSLEELRLDVQLAMDKANGVKEEFVF